MTRALSSVDYGLSSEDALELKSRADSVIQDVESGKLAPEDLAEVGKLLEVNAENFDEVKDKPWFKQAWTIVTGERGRLIDQSVANLGKVQVAVIKILDTLLQKNVELKEDVLNVLGRIDVIETDIHQLKYLLLKFNERNGDRYRKLRRDLKRTQGSVRLILLTLGATLLILTVAGAIPLTEWDPDLIPLLSGGVAALLLGRAAYSYWSERTASPIKVKGGSVDRSQLSRDTNFKRTESFLLGGEENDSRVFNVKNNISELEDYFTISGEEQRLLFSIQHYLTKEDAKGSLVKKWEWLRRWEESIEESLDGDLVTDSETLFRGLEEVSAEGLPDPKIGILLLEAKLFKPYFQLSEDEEAFAEEYSEETHSTNVNRMAFKLGFDLRSLKRAERTYEEALDEIPPSNIAKKVLVGALAAVILAITGGALAPVIGGAIGATFGLTGAAAVSSGLAFLGGGALAAGGMGVAGGTAVLIGGGAVLGASAGSGLAALLSKDKTLTLRELAKLEAITKVYLAKLLNSNEAIRAVVDKVKATRQSLKEGADSLSWRESREAKKAAKYCDRFVERIEGLELKS